MKRFHYGIIILMMSMTLNAAPRSTKEAATLAADFLNGLPLPTGMYREPHMDSEMRLIHQVTKPHSAEPALYVFSSPDGGWVIVSADDNTRDILGYSENSTFDGSKPNITYMLDYYAEQIAAVRLLSAAEKEHVKHIKRVPYVFPDIDPLLANNSDTIQWNQGAPFNNMCPTDAADDTRSATGSAATAAAQIMYYWRWPEHGLGSHSYKWISNGGSYGHDSVDFTTGTYDWNNMLPKYHDRPYSQVQAGAVAQLMHHVGVAADMCYGAEIYGGSSTTLGKIGDALYRYFGYKNAEWHTQWNTKDYLDKEKHIDRELMAKHPVLMIGGNHAFVCDGADGNGLYHINWGWGGYSDGFFSLTILDPDYKGIGSNATNKYERDFQCLLGLEPERHPIRVNGISFTHPVVMMKLCGNASLQEIITFSPHNASNKGLVWSSSDEDIVTVDSYGNVQSISVGTATITATTCDGRFSADCEVNVSNEIEDNSEWDTELEVDKIVDMNLTWDEKKKEWKFHLYKESPKQYPYLKFYIPGTSETDVDIAGVYSIGDEARIHVWPSELTPNLEFDASSGWVKITCVGKKGERHGGNIYWIETRFSENGESYHACYTTELYHRDVAGNYLHGNDSVGDGATPTVTFKAMGESVCSYTTVGGKLDYLPKVPDYGDGVSFMGWCGEENYNDDQMPTFIKKGTTIKHDTTLYAVFCNSNSKKADYRELASIQFKATTDNDSAWYFDQRGNAHAGYENPMDLIHTYHDISGISGAWVRSGAQGIKIGGHEKDNAAKITTDNNSLQGYIELQLPKREHITKVVVSSAKTSDNDNGKLIVYFDNKQYQDPIVYGDDIEYIPTEPMVADLLTLATNRSAAYIKSVTIYTTGSGSYSTSVQDTEDTVVCSGEGANGRMGEWTKVMENGQLFIIKNGVAYNIFGTRVQ